MKKFSLIMLAIVLVFGLALASCGGGDDGSDPGGTTYNIQGTYTAGEYSYTFTGTSYEFYFEGYLGEKGTFSITGNIITITTTELNTSLPIGVSYDGEIGGTWDFTIIDDNTIVDEIDAKSYIKSN